MRRRPTKHQPGRRPQKPLSKQHVAIGEVISKGAIDRDLHFADVAKKAAINATSFSFQRRGLQDFSLSQLIRAAAVVGYRVELVPNRRES